MSKDGHYSVDLTNLNFTMMITVKDCTGCCSFLSA